MPLVVVDPGHGGTDPGATGNGLQEKDINLAAGLQLRDALQRCGIQVIMTRTEDVLPLTGGTIAADLTYRASLANQNRSDLFVSWHVNSYSDPSVSGVSVYIYPSTRGTTTETVATAIVNAIAQATGQKNRGVYVEDFAVLRETSMTAVLVESGFITNPQEAAQLASAAFRAEQAEAAAQAICQFFDLPYVAPAASPVSNPSPSTGETGEQIPDFAQSAVNRVVQAGLLVGYPDGTFRPNQPVTRAELAIVLTRFYDFLQSGRTL
ncbi:N-acetylmuramoyl-L-alanine amidase [Effusibacillus dendaii]|uniref:N-acetylmuramoyl-L-alanine amidase n=1 Tax=Effusibacillus dendaii TaxID=2743772 RepID=A0A7I8DCZ4_9BACL|nr:N-acetylmuramoyl-L-alanine amidase [Effusibacillus dendaii]BCJ88058.1 N-acetylmuramoyl-L-alanine amidase [Effusibacillus dendaii]